MVDTSLEIECNACGNKFWYNGMKNHPEGIECPECNSVIKIPENG